MRAPQPPSGIVSRGIGRLKRRADFLRAAKGKRWHSDAMTVQAAPVVDGPILDGPEVRIGYTLTRKVGNAVARNRIRRRLKEAVRLSPDLPVARGRDYVLIGRAGALHMPFEALRQELARALTKVMSERQERRRSKTIPAITTSAATIPARETRPKRTGPEP